MADMIHTTNRFLVTAGIKDASGAFTQCIPSYLIHECNTSATRKVIMEYGKGDTHLLLYTCVLGIWLPIDTSYADMVKQIKQISTVYISFLDAAGKVVDTIQIDNLEFVSIATAISFTLDEPINLVCTFKQTEVKLL